MPFAKGSSSSSSRGDHGEQRNDSIARSFVDGKRIYVVEDARFLSASARALARERVSSTMEKKKERQLIVPNESCNGTVVDSASLQPVRDELLRSLSVAQNFLRCDKSFNEAFGLVSLSANLPSRFLANTNRRVHAPAAFQQSLRAF